MKLNFIYLVGLSVLSYSQSMAGISTVTDSEFFQPEKLKYLKKELKQITLDSSIHKDYLFALEVFSERKDLPLEFRDQALHLFQLGLNHIDIAQAGFDLLIKYVNLYQSLVSPYQEAAVQISERIENKLQGAENVFRPTSVWAEQVKQRRLKKADTASQEYNELQIKIENIKNDTLRSLSAEIADFEAKVEASGRLGKNLAKDYELISHPDLENSDPSK